MPEAATENDSLPDVQPVSVDDFIERARKAQEKRDKNTQQNKRNDDEDDAPKATQEALPRNPNTGNGQASADTPTQGTPDEASSLDPPKQIRMRRPKKSKEVYPEGDLRGGMAKGVDSGTTPYESLRQAGHIAPETEFVPAEETS